MESDQRHAHVGAQVSSSSLPPVTSRGTLSASSSFSTRRPRYELIVRQQPQRGRQCALGSRERRPIDPPPICQLSVRRPDGSIDVDAATSSVFCVQVLLIPATQAQLTSDLAADKAPRQEGATPLTDTPSAGPSSSSASSSHSTAPSLPPSIPRSNAAAAEARATPTNREHATVTSVSPPTSGPSPSSFSSASASPTAPSTVPATSSTAVRESPSSSLMNRPPPAPPPATRRLEGKTYSSGHVVKDLDGQSPACFFVFPDLSIRDEGLYSLQFNLIRLMPGPGYDDESGDEGPDPMVALGSAMQSSSMARSASASSLVAATTSGPTQSTSSLAGSIVASATSVVFENYSPRRFPGSLDSTPLTRALAGQGVLAPIRNYSTSGAAAATTPATSAAAAAAVASSIGVGLGTGPSSVASGTASSASSRRGSAASTGRGGA